MELSLAPEFDTGTRFEWGVRGRCKHGAVEPCTCCRLQLVLQQPARIRGPEKEITIDPLEVARNLLARDGLLDEIDGGCVAVRREARAVTPVQSFDLDVQVVD